MTRRLLLTLLLLTSPALAQSRAPVVVTADIDRFWAAYDRIVATTDSAAQVDLITRLYIAPGTPGLIDMMTARRYTAEQYVQAINAYPKYWRSVRRNTMRASSFGREIEAGVAKLRAAYPALTPAPVYFVIGVFRSGGTILNGRVLIGAELAMADSSVDTSEFPASLGYVRTSVASNPIRELVPLTVHEYVHTQQRDHEYVLLHRAIYEGIAEFVSVQALGVQSSLPALAYGRANMARVRERFAQSLLSAAAIDGWLYNSTDNEFGVRDLGYYVGYEIAAGAYQRAADKGAAIRQLIELDYANRDELARVIDASGYFERPWLDELARYQSQRPYVVSVPEIRNGDSTVAATLSRITINFSEPMDPGYRSFNFGPLGASVGLRLSGFGGFSPDRRSAVIEVTLQPGRRYQLLLDEGFRNPNGVRMRPYLIDFTTAKQAVATPPSSSARSRR